MEAAQHSVVQDSLIDSVSMTNHMTDHQMTTEQSKNTKIIFFDGVCNLCNQFIDFVIRHDRQKNFKVASLQGETAKRTLSANFTEQLNSVVLYLDGEIFTESTAALKVFAELPAPWRWLKAFFIIPRFLRDPAYRLVANILYRVFGRRRSCRLPTAEERQFFLD